MPHLTLADLASRSRRSPLHKASKASVDYTDHASVMSEQCRKCRYFLAKLHRCTLVEGEIAPAGWCSKFERKP